MKPLQFYYDSRCGDYWLSLPSGSFLALSKSDLKLHLRDSGLRADAMVGSLNELEKALAVAQLERAVDYSGPLAGHEVGPYVTTSGQRILVTHSVSPPKPVKGSAEPLIGFFNDLFGVEQTEYVLAWLKVARDSAIRRDFRPGQMLVLAGPSNCGKSFFQALVTEWLGGRVAKPYRYMIGETTFNGDLAAAEHWAIEDEHGSTDTRTRRKFGTELKSACVNRDLSVHAKTKNALTLPTFRRLTLSVNDEPENLMILPPLDSSIADKVMLLKCTPAALSSDREENWKRYAGNLPNLAFELDRWKIRKGIRCPRFGVKEFHHPELCEALSSVSPESRLDSLICEVLKLSFCGSAEELEKRLRASPFNFAIDKLLHFSTACGVYLSRLCVQKPERYSAKVVEGRREYSVRLSS